VLEAGALVIEDTPLKLYGIAAPPRDTLSMVGLHRLIDGRILTCHMIDPRQTGGTAVAGCEAAGLDIGAQLVEAGFALDCPAVSNGRYRAQEARARAAGHDLAGRFPLPATCVPATKSRSRG
jgi:endonuclease YncB( thermonuclease family)